MIELLAAQLFGPGRHHHHQNPLVNINRCYCVRHPLPRNGRTRDRQHTHPCVLSAFLLGRSSHIYRFRNARSGSGSRTVSISPERLRPLPLPDQRIVARIATVFIQFGGPPGHGGLPGCADIPNSDSHPPFSRPRSRLRRPCVGALVVVWRFRRTFARLAVGARPSACPAGLVVAISSRIVPFSRLAFAARRRR